MRNSRDRRLGFGPPIQPVAGRRRYTLRRRRLATKGADRWAWLDRHGRRVAKRIVVVRSVVGRLSSSGRLLDKLLQGSKVGRRGVRCRRLGDRDSSLRGDVRRHRWRIFLGFGRANHTIGGLIMELDARGRLELRRATMAAEECRQRLAPVISPIVGQHGQADFGGDRFALGVAGRDGHVGRLAWPGRGGRIAVTVALDLHLQIGIDAKRTCRLVQARLTYCRECPPWRSAKGTNAIHWERRGGRSLQGDHRP